MSKQFLRLLLGATLALAVLVLAACGGGDDGTASDGSNATQSDFAPVYSSPEDAEEGGTLTVLAGGGVDSLDPGSLYNQFGYMISFATQRSLLGWPSDEYEEPVPDLADGDPEVGDDGRELTFTIKEGVNYSPPVDREVVAADFKYAIERGLLPGVANGYMGTYLSSLVGFEDAVAAAEADPTVAPDISGIEVPDDRTLILRFEQPDALAAMHSLSLPLGAPVPEEYAAEFDAQEPSAYGQNLVATGPYMVRNDESGALTGFEPGQRIDLVRNPNWDPEADFRPAYLEEINVRLGFTDPSGVVTRILDGEATVSGDISFDPAALREAADSEGNLILAPIGANRYITLNTQLAPFDDLNVRKAILAAVDREALRLTRGGEIVGPIANHFIPPEMPGFEEAGGYEGTGVDFLEEPSGNIDLAAEYMRQAGFESGTYEGDAEIVVVGINDTVDQRASEVFNEALRELGFEVDYRAVTADAFYSRFCTVPEQEIHACTSLGWLKDFNDARTILEPTFSGAAIQETNNTNVSLLDVPEINSAMEEARSETDPSAAASAWGEIDRMITAQAAAVPWIWDYEPTISSPDVETVINAFAGNTDLSATSLRSP